MTYSLQIVIPCFNEFDGLSALLVDCETVISSSQNRIGFVIVNNGSFDRSQSDYQIFFKKIAGIQYLQLEDNLGYGAGIAEGLKLCNADFVGWTHADLQIPLTSVLNCLPMIDNGCQFIKGRRFGRKPLDWIFSKGMAVFESILFKHKLFEVNAQPTVLNRKFLLSWENPPNDFSFDLYHLVMAKQSGVTVSRIDVKFGARKFGNSSWNTGFKSKIVLSRRTMRYSFELLKSLKTSRSIKKSNGRS
jgi:glycosyltransferase involved in cell wall biosynthesis